MRGAAAEETLNLLGESKGDFEANWTKRGFPFIAATDYRVVESDSDGVSVVSHSENANRAMIREVSVQSPKIARLSWNWRVTSQLTGEPSERSKSGDDFAARVFVVFETSLVPTRTRAINYVWAAKEVPDTSFPSPYTDNVMHIVLRNTGGDTGEQAWQTEARDVMQDYLNYFGQSASEISGVAIMTDTDNTDGRAAAEFTNLKLEISPAPQDSGS